VQEQKTTKGLRTEELTARTVTIFLESNFKLLTGNWFWDMAADAVFCSDVMLSLPMQFVGVKGIIHPEDVETVRDKVSKEKSFSLEFRIITTYGEVKTITGERINIEKTETGLDQVEQHLLQTAAEEMLWKKDYEFLQQLTQIYERTERYSNTGVWWYNENTNECWYSAHIFRIYDLPPFSLNAHLDTFTPFIHPEDREVVIEFVDKAYKEKAPLHLEYRIVTPAAEKYVLHTSQWIFNAKGESVLSGTLQDITEQKEQELELKAAKEHVQFYKHQIAFDEQNISIAHWYVNLFTRKTVYSDNYYRIFGLRPKSVPAGIAGFINSVHPEDREMFSSAFKKMLYEHKVPEIEFRILRTDGKLRYISQKAKQVTDGNDMVITGTIQDVTVQKMLEKRLKDISEKEAVREFLEGHIEEMANIGSWIWDISTNAIQWSNNFYKLLGVKSSQVSLTQKQLIELIHPDDQKLFTDEVSLATTQKKESSFTFRLMQRGKERTMKASFNIMKDDDKETFIGTIQDVTNESILQNELSQRVQLAEALSENILDRVIITDESNNIILWNKQCESTYALKKDEVIGKHFFDVFPKLKTEDEVAMFNRVLKGEAVSLHHVRSVMGTGYYNLHLLPLWNENEVEVNGIIHIVHDVTKEMELQQSLNERLSLIENIVESSVDKIIAIDRNLNYLLWNKKGEEYYGLRKEQVIGKNVLEIFPETGIMPGYDDFRRVLKGEMIHIPANKEDKDNHEIYLVPVKNNKGDITAILWMLHDLSKDVKAEKKIIAQANLLQTVFDASPQGIILFRVIRNHKNEIVDYEVVLNNRTTQKWNNKDLAGKRYGDEFPFLKENGIFDGYNKVLQTGEGMDIEVFYEGAGFKNWFRITAVKLNDDELVATAQDITQRKKAEEELQKSLTILQHTEELAQTGSWEYEIESGSFHWSEGMYKLFGLPQQMKVQPEIYIDHAIEEDRSVAKRIVNMLRKKHEPFEELLKMKRENEVRLLRIKASVVTDEKGKAQKIIGVDLDITDVHQAEEKLKETQRWLEQTTKASPDAISVYDLQKKQSVYLNNCLSEWLGICNDKLIEMGPERRLKLVHPDDRLPLLHFIQKTADVNVGEVAKLEYRIQTHDGKLIWLRNRSKVFQRDALGKATHILNILQNVTEEVELREELKRRIQFAETILDESVDRITVFDRNYRFVGWNKRCSEIHGKTKEEVIGKTIFEMFPGVENHSEFMNAQQRSLKGEYVHVPLVKDGFSGACLELFYVPLKNESGETFAVVNIMHDVSNYVKNTEALDALNKQLESKNSQLEQKNEEITSFAFVASHDMKEPLRKIHTFSDWLVDNEKQWLSQQGKTIIDKMHASVKRMEVLIEDILVLTKIHSDTNREEDVDLDNVLQQVKEEMKEQLLQTNAVINATKLPVIKGNGNQVFYLFQNLVSNAIKFQKPGSVPQLSITSEMISGSELKIDAPSEEYVKLSFTDNGFGFDQRYAKKVFQVFQRLHGKQEFEGTGIGLAICKKVMENHNGLIEVKSELGKGSVFNCFFPLH
jgi:PAS domain S-box-containing protein